MGFIAEGWVEDFAGGVRGSRFLEVSAVAETAQPIGDAVLTRVTG